MFRRISINVRSSRVHKKTIEIGGIGALVYGFLAVTRMRDLMVSIGLLFSLAALLAATHALYIERRWWLFAWGIDLPHAVVGERSNVVRKCVLWLSASRPEGEFGCVDWLDTLIALRADGSRTSA